MSSSTSRSGGATVPRPWRALAIVTVLLIILGIWMGVSGVLTPKLGLDLRGGTQVTLVPRVIEGAEGEVTDAQIDQAVEIIRQRVNGLGVSEAEVAKQGSGANATIVVSVPGATQSDVVELVGRTALLNFRPVLQIAAATPIEGAAPTEQAPPIQPEGTEVTPELTEAFAGLDCTQDANRQGGSPDEADKPLVTCDASGAAKYLLSPAVVEGTNIREADAVLTQDGLSEWVVLIQFDSAGTASFAEATTDLVDNPEPTNQFAIVLDGVVQSAPRVISPITDGRPQITGQFTQETAQNLSQILRYGALPLAFETADVQTVSPTLGDDQLQAGLIAGAIGLLLVALYSLLYYRGLGVVVILSLAVAAAMTYGLLVFLGEGIGYTLTLAGIAGVIVAIGITADSFVVLFERIRDQVREGQSLRVATETGWARARRTIVLADIVSLMAATILYVLAVGNVRGFAFTLGLTTLVDLVVVFLFTKPVLTLLARTKFFGEGRPLSGMSDRSLGIPSEDEPTPVTVGQEA